MLLRGVQDSSVSYARVPMSSSEIESVYRHVPGHDGFPDTALAALKSTCWATASPKAKSVPPPSSRELPAAVFLALPLIYRNTGLSFQQKSCYSEWSSGSSHRPYRVRATRWTPILSA